MDKQSPPQAKYYFKGIPVSSGVAIGKAFLLSGEDVKFDKKKIAASEIEAEIDNLHDAIEKTRAELKAARRTTQYRIGKENATIFDMQHLVLDDPLIREETIEAIREKKMAADYAFYTVMQKYQDQLAGAKDEYFQERTADLRDIKRRVIRNIQGHHTDYLHKLNGTAIIIARDLTPSDTIAMDRHKILGFITDFGGKTSHSSIIARSYGVPAAVGMRHLTEHVKNGDRIILDGNEGAVYINPDRKTLQSYQRLQKKIHAINKQLSVLRDLPARTLDGGDVELAANIEFTDEVENVIAYGARGIGLFRTDYLFLARPDLPSEDEQFREYKSVAERVRPYPVIIRTLDVGGDKNPESIQIPPETNPYLGYRAIRISLEHPEIFMPQLRAILRASAFGRIKLLFPMVSNLTEVREIKTVVQKAKNELRKKKLPFDEKIEIGVMIEVPAAAVIADLIASEVDFLSIGTNDLVQYLMAVDRGNERIAYLYRDLHPAVLRVIHNVVQAAHKKGTWVGICGEMGANPLATLILLGLGIDEISVIPIVLPEIKKIIRSIDHQETVRVAEKVLEMGTPDEVENFMMRYMRRKFKDMTF